MSIVPKTIILYRDKSGKELVAEWMNRLRDPKTRRRISKRILRMEHGNYGDYKPVGSGVYELRLSFGPGYRVYFSEDGDKIVILLCGGDKSTQSRDIRRAQGYLKEFASRD